MPNEEVRRALSALAGEWLRSRVGGSEDLEQLLCALLGGDAATVEQYLSRIVELTLSYHDTGRDAGRDAGRAEPERMFHGFIVGLLVSLADRWDVRSNRESGHGRYDVMLLPKKPGDPGVVMELKVLDRGRGDTEQTTLDSALAQVRARDYAAELRARGAAPIHEFAAVFEGKSVWVRCAAP